MVGMFVVVLLTVQSCAASAGVARALLPCALCPDLGFVWVFGTDLALFSHGTADLDAVGSSSGANPIPQRQG